MARVSRLAVGRGCDCVKIAGGVDEAMSTAWAMKPGTFKGAPMVGWLLERYRSFEVMI